MTRLLHSRCCAHTHKHKHIDEHMNPHSLFCQMWTRIGYREHWIFFICFWSRHLVSVSSEGNIILNNSHNLKQFHDFIDNNNLWIVLGMQFSIYFVRWIYSGICFRHKKNVLSNHLEHIHVYGTYIYTLQSHYQVSRAILKLSHLCVAWKLGKRHIFSDFK